MRISSFRPYAAGVSRPQIKILALRKIDLWLDATLEESHFGHLEAVHSAIFTSYSNLTVPEGLAQHHTELQHTASKNTLSSNTSRLYWLGNTRIPEESAICATHKVPRINHL